MTKINVSFTTLSKDSHLDTATSYLENLQLENQHQQARSTCVYTITLRNRTVD
ncbi:hypothetical protein MY11210_009482 [Beauveria gryllotalpidicola]